MIDVFFCQLDDVSPVRRAITALCWTRWQEESGIRLTRLCPSGLGVSAYEFQRQRRVTAGEWAVSPIYVVVDGDILLPRDAQILEMVGWLERSAGYAMLAPRLIMDSIYSRERGRLTAEGIRKRAAIGGARFCRKMERSWPPMGTVHSRYLRQETKPCYDRIECEALAAAGYRVGTVPTIRWWHVGAWYSTVWDYPSMKGAS